MPSQFNGQAHNGQPTNGQFYDPTFSGCIPPQTQPTPVVTNWPPLSYGGPSQSSSTTFVYHQPGHLIPNQPTVNPNDLRFFPPNSRQGSSSTAGLEYQYGFNNQTIAGDGYRGTSTHDAFPENGARRASVASSSTPHLLRSRPPPLAPAPTRTPHGSLSFAGYPVHTAPHDASFYPMPSRESQFSRSQPFSPGDYQQNLDLGVTSPSSITRSASSSPPLRPKRRRPYHTHAKNAKPSGSQEVNALSPSRLSPHRLGLQTLPPTSRRKLSLRERASREQLLATYVWFTYGSAEPPVTPDDEFVKREYIRADDRSRFCAFYDVHPVTKKCICRIEHDVKVHDELVPCEYEVDKPKDVIAHVCDVLNYRPYPCEGKGRHARCEKMFLTNERRNDHYSKENSEVEIMVNCRACGISTRKRNFKRHKENCKLKASTSRQS